MRTKYRHVTFNKPFSPSRQKKVQSRLRPLEWRGSIPSCLHFSQECGHTPPMQIYGRTMDPSSFCAHCSLHVCSKRSRLDWRLSGEKNRNCDQATHFLLLVSIPIALPKFLCSFCQYVMSSSFGFSMGCPLTRVNCPFHYAFAPF